MSQNQTISHKSISIATLHLHCSYYLIPSPGYKVSSITKTLLSPKSFLAHHQSSFHSHRTFSVSSAIMEASFATAQSMRNITTTKLAALSTKQEGYEKTKHAVLRDVAARTDAAGKVQVLLDAFKKHEIKTPSNVSTSNIRRFLEQSRHDSSISSSRLSE